MIQLVREILQNLPMWTPLSMLQTAACLAAEALTGRYTGRQDQSFCLSAVCLAAARQDRRS